MHREAPSVAVTKICCCFCVVADSREDNTIELMISYGGRKSGSNFESQNARGGWAILYEYIYVGFSIHLFGLSSQAECNPLTIKSQFSDVGCSEHRHGPLPGSKHASYCTDRRLACPVAESARINPQPSEDSKPAVGGQQASKKSAHFTWMYMDERY